MEQPDWEALSRIPLADWHPRAQLRAPETSVERTAVPAVDVHNHLGRWLTPGTWPDGPWMIADPGALVADMDACRVETVVNLDGMWGDEVSANVERYDRAYEGRFLTFGRNDWWVIIVGWLLIALICLLVWLLMRSPWGRVLKGIR